MILTTFGMASVLDIIKHYQRDIEKHSDDEAKVRNSPTYFPSGVLSWFLG